MNVDVYLHVRRTRFLGGDDSGSRTGISGLGVTGERGGTVGNKTISCHEALDDM